MHRSVPTVKEITVHGLLLVVPLLVLFPGVFLRGEMTAADGALRAKHPWREYLPDTPPTRNPLAREMLMFGAVWYSDSERIVDNGEWPLWHELQFGGMPLLANGQSTLLYPPRLLDFFLDPFLAITLRTLLKLWLNGMVAYFCARSLALGIPSARFLSVGWMLVGFNMVWAYWPNPDVNAWIPILFVGVELLLARRYQKGFFTLTFGATLALLAGQPQTAFAQGLGLGVYFVLRILSQPVRWRDSLHAVLLAATSWGVALLVSSAALIPFVEYILNSARSAGLDPVADDHATLRGEAAIAFWVPRFFGASCDGNFRGTLNSNYVGLLYAGIATTIAVPLAFAGRAAGAGNRKLSICLAVAGVSLLAMAFPVSYLKPVQNLPVLNLARGFHHASFGLWALMLLAAMGVDKWFACPRRPWEARWSILACFVATAVVVLFLVGNPVPEEGLRQYVLIQCAIAAIFGFFGIAIVVAYCVWPRPRLFASLFLAVLTVDLLVAARGLHPTTPRDHLFPETEVTDYLRNLPKPFRLWAVDADIPPGYLQYYALEQWNGYDGIVPARVTRYFQSCYNGFCWSRAMRIAAVDYHLYSKLVTPKSTYREFLEPVIELDGVEVWRDPEAMPRARLVGRVETVPDVDALFARMCALEFDPTSTAISDAPPDSPLPEPVSANLGRAEIVTRTSTRLAVDVQANADCVLVVADAYYPGWRASIDGAGAEIFPVYHMFRGVIVPAGDHAVEFTYRPWSFRLGLAISIVAMTVSIAGSILLLVRRRRRRSVP